MALSRKYLQGMGLTEEQVNAIIEANEDTISGLKDEIEKYKTASENATKNLNKVQKELDTLKDEADKADGKNPYKVKYDALKEQFEKYKADVEAENVHSKKVDAYKKLLKDTGVSEKRIDAILKVTDVGEFEIDNEGNFKDAKKLADNIKSEWSDFITTESQQGANTANPPQNNGGGKMTRAEIYKKDEHGHYILSTAERQKALVDSLTTI